MKKIIYTVLVLLIVLLSGCVSENKQISDLSDFNVQTPVSFLELSQQDKEQLVSVVYVAVSDYFNNTIDYNQTWSEKFSDLNNRIFIGFRVDGKKKGSWSAQSNNLAESVYKATINTLNDNRYEGQLTREESNKLKVEIFVLDKYKEFDKNFYNIFEPGIYGLRFEKGDLGATYYNSVQIEKNYDIDELMQQLCLKAGLNENCYNDKSVKKYYFETIHFGNTEFSDVVVTWYRCNIVDFVPNPTLDDVKQSKKLAEKWLIRNLNDNGYFNYMYMPGLNGYSSGNNMIRQLMASRRLAEMSSEDKSLLELHKKNLVFVFSEWYLQDNNLGYIYFENNSKLGANAMALRTLTYSPYFNEYKQKADNLAYGILRIQHEDGSFDAWYIKPENENDPDYQLTFYSGEAILALIEYYEKTGEKKYLNAAIKSQDYYINKYVTHLKENYYPAYVPWHTICLNKLYKITKNRKYAEALFILNDKLLEIQNTTGLPYPDYLGRFYNPKTPQYGVPHSASDGVYTEGLAYAYEVAKLLNDKQRMQTYSKAIALGVHNIINLQFKKDNLYYFEDPSLVEGGIRIRVNDNRVRVDCTQHVIDAFAKIIDVFSD